MFPRSIKQYEKTYYIRQFDKTSKFEDLDKAISELKSLFDDNGLILQASLIKKIYNEEKSNPVNCVTMIWTSDIAITALINCALVVDSVNSYPNIDEDDFSFYFKFLEDKNLDYKTIIDKYIKFMRILNTCIVTLGTPFNDTDRVTYRGISKNILPATNVGQSFRIANWLSTSEDKQISEEFMESYDEDDQLMVEFHIKRGCFNAGRINKFGKSCYPSEMETLIPPYTVVKLISKEDNYAILEVAKDNKDYNIDMKMSCE